MNSFFEQRLKLGLFFSFLLTSLYIVFLCPHPSKSLRGWGSDHYSHYASAVLFAHHGFEIYQKPAVEFCSHYENQLCTLKADPKKKIQFTWGQLPKPYPIGLYFLHAPQAISSYLGWTDFKTTNAWLIVEYLLLAHLLLWIIFRDLYRRIPPTNPGLKLWLSWLLIPLLWTHVLRHTAAGFYEAITALLIWISLRELFWQKRPEWSVLCFALALFIGYRALWFFWIPPVAFWFYLKSRTQNPKRQIQAGLLGGIALILILISLYGFYLYSPWLDDHQHNNALHFAKWLEDPKGILRYILPWIGLTLFFVRQRAVWVLLSVATQALFFFTTVQTQSWHIISLIPFFILGFVSTPKTRVAVAMTLLYLLQSNRVFKNDPFSGDLLYDVYRDQTFRDQFSRKPTPPFLPLAPEAEKDKPE